MNYEKHIASQHALSKIDICFAWDEIINADEPIIEFISQLCDSIDKLDSFISNLPETREGVEIAKKTLVEFKAQLDSKTLASKATIRSASSFRAGFIQNLKASSESFRSPIFKIFSKYGAT